MSTVRSSTVGDISRITSLCEAPFEGENNTIGRSPECPATMVDSHALGSLDNVLVKGA